MHEIKCPHCGKKFTFDEAGYADILNQVRTKEFNDEVHEKLEQLKVQYESNLSLVEEKTKNSFEKELSQKEKEIAELQSKIGANNQEKEIAISKVQADLKEKIAEQERKIVELSAKSQAIEKEKEYEVKQALSEKEKEIADLLSKLNIQNKESELEKNSIKEKYELTLRQKDETIAFYKDFKAKQSTKMVGESLEQHCEYEFNRLRMTAFPNAEFKKDNDARTGSKGDYIYREYDESGVEIISIMFEMKNEDDTTATKMKNENFFKELVKIVMKRTVSMQF